jgi:ubiquinol-cytochrome c reductase cytochrome b subunit
MYVLPYGQMSLWGYLKLAPHVYFLISNYIPLEECQDILFHEGNLITSLISNINYTDLDFMGQSVGTFAFAIAKEGKEIKRTKIRANLRIGPHNKDILSILFGSLLGDAHAEFRLKGNGTRINFYQEGSHVSYLIWLYKLISELGYCNTNLPKITTRLCKKGVVRKIIRFKT